jgi:hypothetical protein
VRTDPLTGASYDREHHTYTYYHGLSPEEADRLMECQTYRERDALFAEILAEHGRDPIVHEPDEDGHEQTYPGERIWWKGTS